MEVKGEWILLAPIKRESSNFIIPDDEKDSYTVFGVGPDVVNCQLNDEVIAVERGLRIKLEAQDMQIVKAEDIVAVIK